MFIPENVVLRDDKTLVIYVNEAEFEFAPDEDYLLTDKKKILLKHRSVMMLAENARITVKPPVLLVSHDSRSFVVSREAAMDGKPGFTAIGEANESNLFDSVMSLYPAVTADNRAYERAVLGILGVHGKIYGSSEMNVKDKSEQLALKAKTEPTHSKDETPQSVADTEAKPEEMKERTGNPVWWDDLGIGLYTDKELDPETFIVTEGQCKGRNFSIKQLYDYKYDSCLFYAERTELDKAKNDDFVKQVFACRRAIRKYGLK